MTKEPFTHMGFIVHPCYDPSGSGRVFFAEIFPSGSRCLPWSGRTSRWWFEVFSVEQDSDGIPERTTWSYDPGGSGGAFTLRGCVTRAMEAVERTVERSYLLP